MHSPGSAGKLRLMNAASVGIICGCKHTYIYRIYIINISDTVITSRQTENCYEFGPARSAYCRLI